MSKAIQINGVTKLYGQLAALDNISLSVEEGQLFGLLGVNGAGKTTLIRILCGITKSNSGSCQIEGIDINDNMQAVKNLIAVSPQETSVAPKLTVRENLTFFAEIYGYKSKAAQERVEEIISQWEFAEVANKQACTLSGGWQRRLSVAIALIGNPKVIFLDEPTLGLDVLARRQLWSSIKSLKGKMTIIITSHYLEEIEYLCDSLAIMSKGKVLAQGTVDEIKALAHADNLEDAFINIAEGEGGKYNEA